MKKPITINELVVTFGGDGLTEAGLELPLFGVSGIAAVKQTTFLPEGCVGFKTLLVGARSDSPCELAIDVDRRARRVAHFEMPYDVIFDAILVHDSARISIHARALPKQVVRELRIEFLGWEVASDLPLSELQKIAAEYGYPLR